MRPDVNFEKIFVLNARVLKLMRFDIKFKSNDIWWESQQKRLQLHNKRSEEAQFELRAVTIFFDRFGSEGVNWKGVHDLSVADAIAPIFWPCEPLIWRKYMDGHQVWFYLYVMMKVYSIRVSSSMLLHARLTSESLLIQFPYIFVCHPSCTSGSYSRLDAHLMDIVYAKRFCDVHFFYHFPISILVLTL